MRPMIRRSYACAVVFGFLSLVRAAPMAVETGPPFPGALDPTFSGDGRQTTDFDGDEDGVGVAVQADGKILAVGGAGGDFAVARYNADGTLDLSFSGDGKVKTDVGGFDYGQAVAIQADGKIVVAGTTHVLAPDGEYPIAHFALARYSANGTLDTSFGGDGTQITGFLGGSAAYAAGVAIQADGKIVVAGSSEEYGSSEFVPFPPFDVALARYNADGTLDTSFSGDGMAMIDLGGSDIGQDVAIQGDGKIVVAGAGLVRYNTDGTLDTSFSADGWVLTGIGGWDGARAAVAIQSDGKIVVSGTTDAPRPCELCADPPPDFALARYNTDGTVDTAFGASGSQTTDFGSWDYAEAIAIQPDGKIVVAGTSYQYHSGNDDFALARYNADGTLDTSFGVDGKQTTDFGGYLGGWDGARDVALQPDGKIVVVGTNDAHPVCYCADSRPDFALARYEGGTGSPDTTPPETTITSGPSGMINDSTPTFSFESSEVGSTFECRVSVDDFSLCSSPYTTSTLSDGSYAFEVRATDAAGNAEPSAARRDFGVDTAPPETTITAGPTGTTTESTPAFSFDSSEGGSTFVCRVDDGAFSTCKPPHTTSPLSHGSHSFQVRATDGAGNTDATPASRSWMIVPVPDYREVVLATSGLVSYWRLGETSGSTAADAKGANNGSYRNGVLFDRPGALVNDSNASASFDGSNDYVSVADSTSLDTGDSFTLEAWVKRSGASSSTRTVLSKGSGSFRLSFVNNVLTLTKSNSGTIARAKISTTDTTGFHHVVATKSGGTVKLYIDGADWTGTVTNRTIANTSTVLNIGRDTAGSEYFRGLIDEVAIYNLPLSAGEVLQHFQASGR